MGDLNHVLTLSSSYSRSHSGQDHTGDCSCGKWSFTGGGYPANWNHIIRKYHAEHVEDSHGR